jgi:hypothetical protein
MHLLQLSGDFLLEHYHFTTVLNDRTNSLIPQSIDLVHLLVVSV